MVATPRDHRQAKPHASPGRVDHLRHLVGPSVTVLQRLRRFGIARYWPELACATSSRPPAPPVERTAT